MRKFVAPGLAALTALVVASPALANTVDYSGLTGAIDSTTLIAALMSVGGVLIIIAVAMMGIRKVLRMVR